MSRPCFRPWLVAAAGLLAVAAARAQVIVDAAYVQQALQRNVQVWDVRPEKDFVQGHLPGALSMGDAASLLRDPNTEDFVATDEVARLLGAAGIDPTRETIVYGARGTWNAYFGRYALRSFGGTKVTVFHDGLEGWQAAGGALATGPARATPLKLALRVTPDPAVSTQEMLARLGRQDVQIIDARTPREFAGADIRALRGGHIPGAVNIPYERNWIDPETPQKLARKQVADSRGMSLKAESDLRALYAQLDPSKETIVYCHSGARASETAGVLEQLGFRNVKVYDSSWLGWGNKLDAPASNETVFNVGALNGRIAAMAARIEALEKELAAAKK
jgi:thiosulfate/3-mercaptopyruvate sulfurtransferase